MPIDVSLTPLSLSHLAGADETALDLCVRHENRSQVAGAAWLGSAHDVGKYTPANGKEPELQANGRVFLVQLRGKIPFRGRTLGDPVSFVRNGESVVFLPFGENGQVVSFTGMRLPTLSLPPLEQ